MKKNLIFSIICSIVAFVVLFAMVCPSVKQTHYVSTGKAESVSFPKEGICITSGEFSSNGTAIVSGQDALVVEFPIGSNNLIKNIEINYKEPIKNNVSLVVELTSDGSFTDITPIHTTAIGGQDACCIAVSPAEYTAIRVWIYQNCKIENVSFYKTPPKQEVVVLKVSAKRYFAVAMATLLVFITAFIIDKRFALSKKATDYFSKNYIYLLCKMCVGIIVIVAGIITEIVYRLLFGCDSLGRDFNIASCAAFCAVYLCVYALFVNRKKLSDKPENAILAILLSVGTLIILSQPAGHICWDLDSHYPLALENSYVKVANYSQADLGVKDNTMVSTTVNTLQQSESAKEALNLVGEETVLQAPARFKITHLPAGVAIAVARMFGANFYTRYMFGQFANLLLYSIICFFAIKKLKTGKMVAATIALFPTNIFIACNYSYDHWVTAFVLLGTCYFVSECEQSEKPITIWETVVMCGAFAIGSLPKQIYILLMALPLFINKKWEDKKAKRNYYLILIACFVAVFAMLVMRSMGAVSAEASGDTRGGEVNPSEQLRFILSAPLEYAKILFKFLFEYLSIGNMKNYISNLAYLGIGKTAFVFEIVLLFTMLTGKNGQKNHCGWWIRVLSFLMYVGVAALTATALYIDFTPLKSGVILGCQARYIIPLLAPVCLTLFGSGIRTFKNRAVYNGAILVVLSSALLFEVISLICIPMM